VDCKNVENSRAHYLMMMMKLLSYFILLFIAAVLLVSEIHMLVHSVLTIEIVNSIK